eukprot:1144912-Pelagomonas_calceolata.AAC.8
MQWCSTAGHAAEDDAARCSSISTWNSSATTSGQHPPCKTRPVRCVRDSGLPRLESIDIRHHGHSCEVATSGSSAATNDWASHAKQPTNKHEAGVT